MDLEKNGREAVWKAIYHSRHQIQLYIDARMTVVQSGANVAVEVWQDVYAIRPRLQEEAEFYMEWLFSDKEGVQEVCTANNLSILGPGIASEVGAIIYAHVKNLCHPLKVQRNLLDWKNQYVILG